MEPIQESVEVAGNGGPTMAGLKLQVIPVDGVAPEVRLTVPEKPSKLVIVIVEVPVAPGAIITLVGSAVSIKRGCPWAGGIVFWKGNIVARTNRGVRMRMRSLFFNCTRIPLVD